TMRIDWPCTSRAANSTMPRMAKHAFISAHCWRLKQGPVTMPLRHLFLPPISRIGWRPGGCIPCVRLLIGLAIHPVCYRHVGDECHGDDQHADVHPDLESLVRFLDYLRRNEHRLARRASNWLMSFLLFDRDCMTAFRTIGFHDRTHGLFPPR